MIRSFQWDLARQVERLDWLIAQLPRYAAWGYHEVHLHLEDAVEYPRLPGVARRDAYSYKQFGRLVDAATRAGLKVVPIVNLLGHTQYLVKVPELRDLNELRAPDGSPLERGQICPLHPRTLEVAEKLLRDMAPFCTAGKVHVGLDESFHLGKHPLSRREVAEIGPGAHFARHVSRLRELTKSLGLEMGMWADMLYFLPEAIPLLPPDVTAYEWYYYAFKRWPRVELFNFKEVDIATPLRKRGIAMYGCPMNGAFRHEPLPHFRDRLDNILSWWRHCRKIGAEGFLVSSWEPNRLAIELTTAIDAAAASLWLDGIDEPEEMLARGFERVFGRRGRAAAKLALAADRYPFGGYPRWEINDRWDTVSRREPLAAYRAERRFFTGLAARARRTGAPAPLRASLEFRRHLAERDVFVRRAARGLATDAEAAAHAQALARGRHAARLMWNRTRDQRMTSPNQAMLARDARRVEAWRRGEEVLGSAWQLCYQVRNFAPACQLVGVEQREPDGSWTLLQACHTIEFQARTARPRGAVVREHAAAVAWDGTGIPPVLRIVVRGMGAVKIGAVRLIGRSKPTAMRQQPVRWRLVGKKPPDKGWPDTTSAEDVVIVTVTPPNGRNCAARAAAPGPTTTGPNSSKPPAPHDQ
jgi:hypothetical protein